MARRRHFVLILSFLPVLVFCLPTLVGSVHQVQAADSPDLTVDSVWLEESSNPGPPVTQVNPGDQFLIVASIKNVGTVTASGFYLDVYYDTDYGRGGPDTIAPGETQVWYVGPLTAQAGTHTTKWIVDPDNQIAELNEGNNEYDLTFTIRQVSVTVAANPSGSIVVDNATYTSPQTFAWLPGSSHTLSANSPVSNGSGTQYAWASWSDGGAQSHTITTPSSPITYTAYYQTRFQVTYSQTGCNLPVPLPPAEWVNTNGTAVGLFQTTVSSIDGKTQCLLQSSTPAGPINAPTVHAATYKTQYYLTITSSYSNSTGQGWYDAGSSATFTVISLVSGGAGTQYLFTRWSSNDASGYAGMDTLHSVTMGGPITETASWKTQWQVTFVVNPSAGGAITTSGQPAATAWFDDGAVVSIQANSGTGYAFSSWSSGATSITFTNSSSPSTAATVHGSGVITGNFVPDKTVPVVTVPADMTVEATSKDGALVTFTASASDAADGSLTATCTPSSGSTFALGSTKVTCSVTDKAGNTGTASFNVNVVDRAPPAFTLPSDMTVQATSTSGAVVTFSASASDLVDGIVSVTCTPASGSTFPLGTTKVTCSTSDKAGNSASGSFQVTVPAVTVKLLASNGNGLSGGVVQYYSHGWKAFGTTGSNGTVSMALPPGTYVFQISYAGASQQNSQNVASDPNVIFRTVQVHSDSSKCTSYIQVVKVPTRYPGGGWLAFTQDMELLPGTYMFRFSDGTKNASHMLVVGAVNHIH